MGQSASRVTRYVNADPTLVRVIIVALALFTVTARETLGRRRTRVRQRPRAESLSGAWTGKPFPGAYRLLIVAGRCRVREALDLPSPAEARFSASTSSE
jgi:hypothetical protein